MKPIVERHRSRGGRSFIEPWSSTTASCASRSTAFAPLLPERRLCSFAGIRLSQCGMCCGKPRDGDTIWRTTDIIQPELVAELDRTGIPAMFPTDAKLDAGARLAATRNGLTHEAADTFTVQHRERDRIP